MLIVNTDHGFLLGEHGWWGKTNMPIYFHPEIFQQRGSQIDGLYKSSTSDSRTFPASGIIDIERCMRFDPHEPFYSLKEDKALYPHTFVGDAEAEADWPPYAPVAEDDNTVEHVRYEYAALLSKCDRYLGLVRLP